MRTASHLAHEPLLLHLAAEVAKSLLELPGILYDDSHSPVRIPVKGAVLLLMRAKFELEPNLRSVLWVTPTQALPAPGAERG